MTCGSSGWSGRSKQQTSAQGSLTGHANYSVPRTSPRLAGRLRGRPLCGAEPLLSTLRLRWKLVQDLSIEALPNPEARTVSALDLSGDRWGGYVTARGICLVIEDDPDIRGLLDVILTRAGFGVHCEGTGAGGLRAAAELDLAFITLDLGLPDMHGHDVARALRSLTKAPILMITAHARPIDELDGMASGASAYLIKPFRPNQLTSLIQELSPGPLPAGPGVANPDGNRNRS